MNETEKHAETGSADLHDDPQYQAFVEEMAKHCRCNPPYDRPCAGVLAGGLCDEMGEDEDDWLERKRLEEREREQWDQSSPDDYAL